MADNEAGLEKATEATAAAVAATQNEIHRVEALAEDAIDNAEDRIEAAEKLAQQLADAALQSEIGKIVSALREDFDKWSSDLQQLQLRTTSLETLLTEQTLQLAEIKSNLASPLPLIPLAPLPTTPALAQETGITEIPVISPQQADSGENTVDETPALEVRRKKKFV